MKFRVRGLEIEASRWFKNGDHPLDYSEDKPGLEGGEMYVFTAAHRREKDWEGDIVRRFRHPHVRGSTPCPFCERPMDAHGWLDFAPKGQAVCPGDWIITSPGVGYRALSDATFGELIWQRGRDG